MLIIIVHFVVLFTSPCHSLHHVICFSHLVRKYLYLPSQSIRRNLRHAPAERVPAGGVFNHPPLMIVWN